MGGSFRKGVQVPIGVPGRGGLGLGSGGRRVKVVLWKMRENGEGGGEGRGWGGSGVGRVGGGVGTGRGTGKLLHTRLSKLPFSKLPFTFSSSTEAYFLEHTMRPREMCKTCAPRKFVRKMRRGIQECSEIVRDSCGAAPAQFPQSISGGASENMCAQISCAVLAKL